MDALPEPGARRRSRQRVRHAQVAERGGRVARRSPELGRLLPLAADGEDRAGRRPGGASTIREQPDVSRRALRARAPDLGHHRHAAPLARYAGVVGLVGALLGLRPAGRGARPRGPRVLPVLVRPLRRLLGGLRGRARPRLSRHPRRRPGLRPAPGRPRDAGRHGDLLHALLCAAPRRGGARARPGPRTARRPDHGARGRAGSRDSGGARPHRGGLGRQGVRPSGNDRDGRLWLRVRGSGGAARQRERVHRRGPGSGDRRDRSRG